MRSITTAGRCRGFTLIEMLVVLLVMGILVGLVSVLAQPDDRGLLRVEAERLAQLLDLAAEEARLSGKSIAWTADGGGYLFWWSRENLGWSTFRDNDLLRARTLPRGMLISALRVENRRPPGAMRLEFAPYGATLAFTIEMALGAERYTVEASPVGDVRALPGKEPNGYKGKTYGDLVLR